MWDFIKLFGTMALFFAIIGVFWGFIENSKAFNKIPKKTRQWLGAILLLIFLYIMANNTPNVVPSETQFP